MSKRIIILGGGYGGVLTAKKLIKRLKKTEGVSIKLIDKNPFHTMLTELHEVAADRVPPSSVRLPFSKIFAGRDIDIICDNVSEIDFENKKVLCDGGTYEYDYLVVGLGAEPAYFSIPGAEEHAFPLWSFDNAMRLREHIYRCFRMAAGVADNEKRKELLTFVIAGAGLTGVEMAGELAEWAPILCDEFKVSLSDVSIYLVDALERPMSVLPEALSKKALKRLSKMGVKSEFSSNIQAVGEDFISLKNGDDIIIKTRTVIWTAGVQGQDLLGRCDVPKAGRCRIQTDKFLQAEGVEGVYVVGDNIYYIPEGEKEPVPQMVENAEHSSELVAHNLVADIKGGEKREYRPKFHGIMVSIGGRYGIAYVGGRKKFSLPSFFAMFVKHFINVIYFLQVAGWTKAYSYVCHEIFQVRHRRSFVGGHFSDSSPNFWKVPLRVFVGISWLLSGLEKLPRILENPSEIFLFNIPSDTISGATDAVSSATAAAAEMTALPVPQFIKGIVDWTMSVFIAPIAPVFQAGMVLAEVVVGALLIAGLFSTPAAFLSALLCLMIYSSGMASYEILWYFFASIALIGGSGSTFGFDYDVLPFLKRWWKGLGFVKKWYIYNE